MQSIFNNGVLSEIQCRFYAAGIWALGLVYEEDPSEWREGVVRCHRKVYFKDVPCDVEFILGTDLISPNDFSFTLNPCESDAKWVVYGSFREEDPTWVKVFAEGWGFLRDGSWSRMALPPTHVFMEQSQNVFSSPAESWGWRLKGVFEEIVKLSTASCRPIVNKGEVEG